MPYSNPDFLVETDWLESNLSNPTLRIIDCRVNFSVNDAGDIEFFTGEDDWISGHIPGAAYVNIGEELSLKSSDFPFMLPFTDQFAEVMSRLGVEDGTRVVLYDEFFNIWAARMWWMLRAFGFTNAAILNGGLNKWKLEDRPLSAGREAQSAGSFTARPQGRFFVDKYAVLSAISDDQTCIVDALPADQYSGEAPVWVDRPGHIASARNLPFNEIVDQETQAYLPPDELASALENLGVDANNSVITYCHAGNAASSVAFAMALMGNDQVSIYDASLREWAADPELPMQCPATG